jgi:hypothetical protein
MLGRAVDQSLARQGDHLGRDGWEVVDRQDAFYLRKQTLDQTKVAACRVGCSAGSELLSDVRPADPNDLPILRRSVPRLLRLRQYSAKKYDNIRSRLHPVLIWPEMNGSGMTWRAVKTNR